MKKAQKLEKIGGRLFTEITSRQVRLVSGGATTYWIMPTGEIVED